jgi:3-phenylpropionate/cinnamic acid dioxygenase small subunit
MHALTNIRLIEAGGDYCTLAANGGIDRYDLRTRQTGRLFVRYTYRLRRQAETWRIAEKRIVILNDLLPGAVDVNAL